jgi:signal transduction histidine kinase
LVEIFDPYVSTKKEKNGVGLGLYMAKSLVEKNGGKLWCENRDDGVVFLIAFDA